MCCRHRIAPCTKCSGSGNCPFTLSTLSPCCPPSLSLVLIVFGRVTGSTIKLVNLRRDLSLLKRALLGFLSFSHVSFSLSFFIFLFFFFEVLFVFFTLLVAFTLPLSLLCASSFLFLLLRCLWEEEESLGSSSSSILFSSFSSSFSSSISVSSRVQFQVQFQVHFSFNCFYCSEHRPW